MRFLDMQTWPRRQHYEFFKAFDHPHFNLCANVDLTALQPFIRHQGITFTVAIVYLITRAANAIPEFRLRIRPQGVVEHEVVHPAFTLLTGEDSFSFCALDYTEDFPRFAAHAARRMEYVKAHPTLEDEPGRDDWLFMTALPWVSFTSFMHPMPLNPPDSYPRFAWGKYFPEGGSVKMPLSVQGHHALMDGIHMARFYAAMQGFLDQPQAVLG